MIKPSFMNAELAGKRVFVRADLNVTLNGTNIIGDYRLQALLPTLNALLDKKAHIILATHIGKPAKSSTVIHDPKLSTHLLLPWFKANGFTMLFAKTLNEAYGKSLNLKSGEILLLENLRFFPGEQTQQSDIAQEFAHQLHTLADYYINDAFGLLHRHDTSITALPKLYDTENKSIGLLIEKELKALTPVREHPQKPYVLILGGGKVADKLPVLEKFLDKVTTILVCPAISFTFMKAIGIPTGKSLVVDSLIDKAKEIMELAKRHNVELVLPLDYQIADENLNGLLSYCDAHSIPPTSVGISIGPKTIELFKSSIQQAQTIYFNGAMGLFSRPETLQALNVLLQTIAQSTNTSIIGGGESVTAVHQLGIQDAIVFYSNLYCSTGGGATLHYLAGYPLQALSYI